MKNLIIIGGRKQSGKTTAAAAIYGYYLTSKGVIPNCHFDDNGKMSIVYNKKTNEGIYFDIDDNSPEMVSFKEKNVWTHVKHVGFADILKNSVCDLFSIPRELAYGTNDQKNSLTHIKWKDIKDFLPEYKKTRENYAKEFLSIRELLEIFGTDVCRKFDDNCHIKSGYASLLESNPDIGIICDMRFDNEFEYFDQIKKNSKFEIFFIKLKREAFKSEALSEQGLPGIDEGRFDLVVDNRNISVIEKNEIIIDYLIDKGVLSKSSVERT